MHKFIIKHTFLIHLYPYPVCCSLPVSGRPVNGNLLGTWEAGSVSLLITCLNGAGTDNDCIGRKLEPEGKPVNRGEAD
jgi:hypothetical protein